MLKTEKLNWSHNVKMLVFVLKLRLETIEGFVYNNYMIRAIHQEVQLKEC